MESKVIRSHLGSVVILTTVVLVATTTVAFIYRNQRRNKHQRRDRNEQEQSRGSTGNDSSTDKVIGLITDETTKEKFGIAVEKMRSKSFVQKLHLSNPDKLMIYGLYKQVLNGDAPIAMPSMLENGKWNIVEEHAKYEAWVKVRGMSTDLAALHYVAAVEHFESLTSDWLRSDGDEDDDYDSDAEHDKYIDNCGMAGPGVVSRPVAVFDDEDDDEDVNNPKKDKFDLVDNDGTASLASQLLRAASQNSVDEIRRLLAAASSSSPTTSQETANITNTTTNITASVPVDVNTISDPSGQTALHIAADKGCLSAVQVLVQEYQADVNVTDTDGISVLQTAVIAGHYDLCEWLLNNTNVNPDQPDNDGDTPRLCSQDDPKIMSLFDSKSSIYSI
jgi:acyl-CoA-binding protein